MATLRELGQYLEDQGVAKMGTTLFQSKLPTSPDSCMAIYLLPGKDAIRAFRSSAGQPVAEQPMFRVTSRSKTFDGAMSASLAAQSALDGLGNTVMSGVTFLYIESLSPPYQEAPDELNRKHVTQKYQVVKKVA